MASDTQFEAQRLVSISLSKMAQSRTQRTGVSLHKSLLVATVLQKARFLCMEEVLRMVNSSPPNVYGDGRSSQDYHRQPPCYTYDDDSDEDDDVDESLLGLADGDEGMAVETQPSGVFGRCQSGPQSFDDSPSAVRLESCEAVRREVYFSTECDNDNDKENLAPCSADGGCLSSEGPPTYFDLDKPSKDQCFRERCSSLTSYSRSLKRRRAICDSEVEEAVQSILPKKTKIFEGETIDDSVFLDEEDSFSSDDSNDSNNNSLDEDRTRGDSSSSSSSSEEEDSDPESKSMDIDRITSLVSIFSFGGLTPANSMNDLSSTSDCPSSSTSSSFGSLTRSSSTPDLCSAQAKEAESMQQRPFLAMTV